MYWLFCTHIQYLLCVQLLTNTVLIYEIKLRPCSRPAGLNKLLLPTYIFVIR